MKKNLSSYFKKFYQNDFFRSATIIFLEILLALWFSNTAWHHISTPSDLIPPLTITEKIFQHMDYQNIHEKFLYHKLLASLTQQPSSHHFFVANNAYCFAFHPPDTFTYNFFCKEPTLIPENISWTGYTAFFDSLEKLLNLRIKKNPITKVPHDAREIVF